VFQKAQQTVHGKLFLFLLPSVHSSIYDVQMAVSDDADAAVAPGKCGPEKMEEYV